VVLGLTTTAGWRWRSVVDEADRPALLALMVHAFMGRGRNVDLSIVAPVSSLGGQLTRRGPTIMLGVGMAMAANGLAWCGVACQVLLRTGRRVLAVVRVRVEYEPAKAQVGTVGLTTSPACLPAGLSPPPCPNVPAPLPQVLALFTLVPLMRTAHHRDLGHDPDPPGPP
jgi:hypothetical protein